MDTDPFQMIHFDYSEDVSFRQVLKQLKHCLQKKDLAREQLLEKEPVQLLFHSTKHQTGMNEKVRDGYDLLMVCRFEKEIVDISFLYNGQLFDDSTVARMLMNFQVFAARSPFHSGEGCWASSAFRGGGSAQVVD